MHEDAAIAICGQAGQGIKTLESLLARLVTGSGYHVFTAREFMSRIRGGMNSTSIRISSKRVRGVVRRVDILVSLHPGGVAHLKDRIGPKTLILGDEGTVAEDEKGENFAAVSWKEAADGLGSPVYANVVAAGALAAILGLDQAAGKKVLEKYFAKRDEETREKNRRAFEQGYQRGEEIGREKDLSLSPGQGGGASSEALMNGTQAVGLGALAGGCNFLSFYPMSPATGVGVFLAGQSDDFNVAVLQAEDEIAAINLSLGAWYAGGRGLVTTSGGGFALMNEGLSLSGMIESPLVIHLGQRPGPATGLPTRTEQGDLLYALFAGHGEFPRAILTPGTIEEAFILTRQAFLLADRFQVPVIVLTDQYLLDSSYNLPVLQIPEGEVENEIVKTEKDYRRYAAAESGVSPRGIPGHGEGLVMADSDEHDAAGRITEDFDVRVEMADKRRRKLKGLIDEAIEPDFFGDDEYRTLLLGWGSTHFAIRECLEELKAEKVGYLHFSQVYPLSPKTEQYLKKASRTVVIENNATGQFARLLKVVFGHQVDEMILQYNGLPFSREEVSRALASLIQGGRE